MAEQFDPISQKWIKEYVNEVLRFASDCGDTPMGRSAAQRAEYISDMVEAWQKRNEPKAASRVNG